jgi:glutathione S-transferase
MYKLIGSPKTRTFRAIWMFEELGVDYEIINTSPRSDEISRYNPSGKIPALLVDDDVIIDSSAIIQYLADRHGQHTFDAGSIERAHQDSFLHFANDDLDGTCWVIAKHTFILPKELRVREVINGCRWDWDRAMVTLEKRLGNNQYVMGEIFTVPDIVIAHVAGWAKSCDLAWPDNKVGEYFKRVRSRPAFKRTWEIRENS